MTKEEFLEKMHEYGIKLGKYQIIVDEYMPISYYLGVYKKNRKWLIYEVGERDQVFFLYEETSEEKIFDEFYQKVFSRLELIGIMNETIDQKTIETFINSGIIDYLLFKGYSVDKIKKIMNEFNEHPLIEREFYLTIMFEKFPQNNSLKIKGYTAEKLYSKYNLNILDTYSYLIYLEKNPEKALKDLKHGLPRK